MGWVCLSDRQRLRRRKEKLCCGQCGRYYDVRKGIPVFTGDDLEKDSVNHQLPLLEELWKLMQQNRSDEAAREFCEKHQCARNQNGAAWVFFFSVPKDGVILEIGAGFGDDTIDLVAKARETISIVPNMTNALIVDKHLDEKELANTKVAVMEDITRLPLANGSIEGIAMEDATAPGFKVTDRNFPAIAAEWARVLSTGGTVFLGLSNRYDRLFRFRSLRSIIQSHDYPESLNRLVKKAMAPWPNSNLRLGQTIRTMMQNGFGEPIVYAPFPDEKKTEVVIPLEDARAVRYFLNNLIRRNSFGVRLATTAASVFVALSLFRYIIPYYFLVFHLVDKSEVI